MITPRGLIFPQLPMGYPTQKKVLQELRKKKTSRTTSLYEITDTETGEKVVMNSFQGAKLMGVSSTRCAGASNSGSLVKGKWLIKKLEKKPVKYIMVDTKTGLEELLTIPDICKKTKRNPNTIYYSISYGSLVCRRYQIKKP